MNRLTLNTLFGVGFAALSLIAPRDSAAVSITSLSPVSGLSCATHDTASVDAATYRSYKGALAPFINDQGYSLPNLFTSGGAPTDLVTLEFIMIGEIAGFANGNEMSMLSTLGGSTSIFAGTSTLGASRTITVQNTVNQYFQLQNAVGELFYSNRNQNVGNTLQLAAWTFRSSGTLTLNNMTLGGGSIIVNVSPEWQLWGWEDMKDGDFDYNDQMMLVRRSVKPIPEPATLGLLSLGALGLPKLRKRLARA